MRLRGWLSVALAHLLTLAGSAGSLAQTWHVAPEQSQLQDPKPSSLQWSPLPAESSNASRLPWQAVPRGEEIPAVTAVEWDAAPKPERPQPPTTLERAPLLTAEEQHQLRTAYSRGSLIQIGETIYPNLGFNALQRQPSSWGSIALVGIDNSFQGIGTGTQCRTGDFTSPCADGLLEGYFRLWNSKAFSFDLQWTMHSLSGGKVDIAGRTGGTSFGEGQSLGFKLSKNLSETFGLSFGANRLIHLDQTTDLPKNFYLIGTKIFKTNPKPESPIISLSLGLMSDVYNPNTNLGTMGYPPWLRGGEYPSIFAEYFDKVQPTSGRGYYPNVAGVTSPFVCADQSIFIGKPISAAKSSCITQVYVGPVGSIGFAPWPWLGLYAIYEGNLNLGLSLKPFKNIPWTISLMAVQPFNGINRIDDAYIRDYPCAGQDLSTCRRRVGIFTDFSF